VAGQPRARGQADSDDIDSGPDLHASHDKQAKEVFETAASLFFEEESGIYTPGPRDRHPGCLTRSPHTHPVRPLPAS
jgi:hypothetical protein